MPSTKQITAVMAIKKHSGEDISFEEASKMDNNEIQAVFKEAKEKGMKNYDEEKAEMDKQNETISNELVVEGGEVGIGSPPPSQRLHVSSELETNLAVQSGIVMPAVSATEAVKAWDAYLDLKKKIATKDDTQIIQGREFFKKSYWRKLATFFNLSVEVIEEREEGTDKNRIYHFVCKATAPNGRYAQGTGTCDQQEKGRKNTIHNTRSTAETRAFNRAVSNLVGGGEVSAEEMGEDSPPKAASNPRPRMAESTLAQRRKIFAIAKEVNMGSEEMKEWVKTRHNLASFVELDIQQAKETIDALQKRLDEMQSETVDATEIPI